MSKSTDSSPVVRPGPGSSPELEHHASGEHLDQWFPIIADSERAPTPLRVLKHGDSFGVFDYRGDIAAAEASEEGLYHDGTRFLSRFELLLYGQRPLLLS